MTAAAQPLDRPVPAEAREAYLAFAEALQKGEQVEALRQAKVVQAAMPGWGIPEYNLACVYGLLSRPTAAKEWLQRAVDCGYNGPSAIYGEADLRIIADEEEFKFILEQADVQQDEPAAIYRAKGSKPDVAAPLVVVLHNFGGNARAVMNFWRDAADEIGAYVMAPQAPIVISPSQRRWGEVDEAERIVLEQVDAIGKDYQILPDRIVLSGLGQGADLACAIALRHPERFAGVIAVGGSFFDGLDVPSDDPGKKLGFSFMVGLDDRALSGTQSAAKALEDAGYPVRLKVYPGLDRYYPPNRAAEQVAAYRFLTAIEAG